MSRFTAVLAALALLLAACNGDAEQTTTPAPTPTAPDAGTPPGPPDDSAQDTVGDDPARGPDDPDGPVEPDVTVLATELEAPWEVVFTPDMRVWVTERDSGALIALGTDGSLQTVQTFSVDSAGEGGLLGLAASPTYLDDELLYAYYTSEQDNRVIRFVPGAEEAEVVLSGIPKANVHNGGRIAFGPDGMLYIGTGDAGEPASSQDPDSMAGKILRITPDGEIPEDNPTAGSPLYALGLRNVQGLTWTRDGALYASELGPDVDDEINRIEPGGNYGWPEVTGEAGDPRFIDPVFVAQPPEASWSGIAAQTTSIFPQWENSLYVAALRGSRLWRLQLDDEGEVVEAEALLVEEHGRLRQVREAPDGSLWVLTTNRDGRGSPDDDDDRILRLGRSG